MQKAVIVEFVKEDRPEQISFPYGQSHHKDAWERGTPPNNPWDLRSHKSSSHNDPLDPRQDKSPKATEVKCDPFDPRCSYLHNLKKITFHF